MIPPPWLQALVIVLAALLVSTVSLLYRYRLKGHPFASLPSGSWSLLIIIVTATPAALALLLPRVPPAYLGVVVPVTLGIRGDRLYKRNQPTEHEVWYQVATLGVRLLLDRLEQRMETDRDSWCETQVNQIDGLEQLEDAADRLYDRLYNRASMRKYRPRLKSHRDAVREAVRRAQIAASQREADRAQHSAEQALMRMLQIAYDSCSVSAAALPSPAAAHA